MNAVQDTTITRKSVGIRLLYTLLYLVVFEILKTIIQIVALFQFVYLLISKTYNERARTFSNKVVTYAYKVMRYVSLNDNNRPFPFSDFPVEMEQPEERVSFD